MFHSAAVKLTLWYLGIIMVLSISFSVAIYNLSRNELIQNNRRQNFYLNDRLPSPNFNSFNNLRQQDVSEGLRNLKGSLLVFNLMVLLAGGAASYALARRTLEPIEEALESQKRFTGDASHELRTPLTVMQTENEVALRNSNLSKKEAVEHLKSNLEEVAKLKMLSDGLLKLASFDNDKALTTAVDMKAVASEALKRHKKIAEAKNIKITNSISSQSVMGDFESLVELTSILLDNAVKYSKEGTEVIIAGQSRNKVAHLSVADQGFGITKKDLPKIFDRFYQADMSRSGKAGYGLGLSIAKRIAEVHNGSIEVSSAPSKGSTFTLLLPTA
jgi:two-component system sensor histidine kinase CiaH